jgi:hypothetical protein
VRPFQPAAGATSFLYFAQMEAFGKSKYLTSVKKSIAHQFE